VINVAPIPIIARGRTMKIGIVLKDSRSAGGMVAIKKIRKPMDITDIITNILM
jgi:hypothetical protein